jgi:hypothetical protein
MNKADQTLHCAVTGMTRREVVVNRYDVAGLIPAYQEIAYFLTASQNTLKYELMQVSGGSQ